LPIIVAYSSAWVHQSKSVNKKKILLALNTDLELTLIVKKVIQIMVVVNAGLPVPVDGKVLEDFALNLKIIIEALATHYGTKKNVKNTTHKAVSKTGY